MRKINIPQDVEQWFLFQLNCKKSRKVDVWKWVSILFRATNWSKSRADMRSMTPSGINKHPLDIEWWFLFWMVRKVKNRFLKISLKFSILFRATKSISGCHNSQKAYGLMAYNYVHDLRKIQAVFLDYCRIGVVIQKSHFCYVFT